MAILEEKNYKDLLYDLLCVVHCDSGEYIDKYGFDRAYFDAMGLIRDIDSGQFMAIFNKVRQAVEEDRLEISNNFQNRDIIKEYSNKNFSSHYLNRGHF
jgi:hypothetical protein